MLNQIKQFKVRTNALSKYWPKTNIHWSILTRNHLSDIMLKAGLSPSKINLFICFNESPSKMMKNAILKIFKFLCWPFGHVEETA